MVMASRGSASEDSCFGTTAGLLFYWAQKSGWKMEGQNGWDRYNCIWEVLLCG